MATHQRVVGQHIEHADAPLPALDLSNPLEARADAVLRQLGALPQLPERHVLAIGERIADEYERAPTQGVILRKTIII